MNWSTGLILQKLASLGIEENTVVIFTSDNGPKVGSAKPLSRKKGSMLEGGHRVPAVIQWKDTIPAGGETTQLITGMDFLPTFAQLAGVPLPASLDIDGEDVSSYLTAEPSQEPIARTFFYDHGGRAIRHGDWKLHEKGKKLFHLVKDPGERKNLAAQHPEKVAELSNLLKAALTDLQNNSRPAGSL